MPCPPTAGTRSLGWRKACEPQLKTLPQQPAEGADKAVSIPRLSVQTASPGRPDPRPRAPSPPASSPGSCRADPGPRPPRRKLQRECELVGASTSWATTPAPPGCAARRPGGAGARRPASARETVVRVREQQGPAPPGLQDTPLAEVLRSSCPACWTTRTTRWCGCSWARPGCAAARPGLLPPGRAASTRQERRQPGRGRRTGEADPAPAPGRERRP